MSPLFDRQCLNCGNQRIDVWEPTDAKDPLCECGTLMERAYITKSPAISGDECDVLVKHGLCNPDGTPRRYRSKAEMAKVAKARGMTNYVQHQGTRSGDKSKHTVRWV